MNAQVIVPRDETHWRETRAKDITSTEVAALFGCSPYLTEFELWHRLRERKVVEIDENDRMKWGTRLESAIAKGIAEDNGWTIRPKYEYMRLPELGLGASFDYEITESLEGVGLLEIKNVDSLAFRDGWLVDDETGEIEAPPHIEIQVQVQLAVSGLAFAKIGALVGGNRVVELTRKRDEQTITAIQNRVRKFWASVESGQAPNPDYVRDAEFIISLHQRATEGKIADVSESSDIAALALAYKEAGEAEKRAAQDKESIKARLLERIGDASKAVGANFTISAGLVKGGPVAYTRADYRNFRINFKKEK